ncbi:25S rRNA (adenine2142-N1)-methyltransferase [Starmerella bacillaris]|uniref:25S rRNA adenine-N(1) methyltransferase n=1 Tax=Starmerella bacillaris TaxID=1247836 RepID=A0AAV5RJA3_STABA|nr:25S rRNA (adenine2142-N1)-methyltransferase [Starmerella bacillaris]
MARKIPVTGRKISSIKPEKARKIIRKYHVLLKEREKAVSTNDFSTISALDVQINSIGGLDMYQKASINGQSKTRGGDSSKLLVDWLKSEKHVGTTEYTKLLEVGCLQVDNYCARSNLFSQHVRIDLNSQNPQIQKQDFMAMPLDTFDVISLSLVVNFVPNPLIRGKMMQRAHSFLNDNGLLFFVLPSACTENSRYFDSNILSKVFTSVGFTVLEYKLTNKLVYYLLKKSEGSKQPVKKQLCRDGPKLNNFYISIA